MLIALTVTWPEATSRKLKKVTGWFQSHPLVDWGFSAMQHTRRSARQIAPFVEKHKIDMSEFEPVIYRSYAEFFTRQFRPGARCFPTAPSEMGAFGEERTGKELAGLGPEWTVMHDVARADGG